MLEIVLTREDANTEHALLAEWLVEDRAEVEQGQPVCVVETTKATVEVESPGSGTIVQLFAESSEVELGKTIAYVAESADELASLDARAERGPAPPRTGERKATRKAVELAEQHGVDLATIEKRGFVTEKDVQAEIDRLPRHRRSAQRSAARGSLDRGRLVPRDVRPRWDERQARRRLPRVAPRRSGGVQEPRPGGQGRGPARPRRGNRRRRGSRRRILRRRAADRARGRCPPRLARDRGLRGGRHDRRGLLVQGRTRAALPPRVPRRGNPRRRERPLRRRRAP